VFVYYLNHLHDLAQQYTHNEHPSPLDVQECHHIAKSVARWTWSHFDIEASDKRFSQLQARRGSEGGKKASAAYEDKRASARLMLDQGMNKAAIARELGVHRNTVNNWLAKVHK